MAEYVLETKNLGISFGGLKAAQNVNLKIEKNQIYGLVGPNGAGKTTIFNLLTGVYKPTTGTFYLNGEELCGLPQEKINHKGIARTFQNIRLFNNMSVARNVMVALHNHSDVEQVISNGERIAQMVITPYIKADFSEVDELSSTERGVGGFGSTGTK